ncbi:hypothetical protein QYE76_040817 [Lolium multiflorum]|uniref:Gnk2-homologous domain-containing protein n=1 Tax=Lolium multiflorum TaxID=4521 RepID=A0AAD8WTJ2_LOLMU|nr:hypothetical protein QYE76_040817 [Lolium multiflorum]
MVVATMTYLVWSCTKSRDTSPPSSSPFLAQLVSCDVLLQECINNGNYTANNTFLSNLRQLSSTLPINASSSTALFSTGVLGDIPNTVYAFTLCCGNTTNASTCTDCIGDAFRDAQQACPYYMDATIYYESCYLRFWLPQTTLNGTSCPTSSNSRWQPSTPPWVSCSLLS